MRPTDRWRRFALAIAGPAVIVLAVLLVMRTYAFRGMITTQHGDILQQWLPVFDYLGRTLRSGHIPAFDPYSMAGVPFAADPQTGWMYLPAMLLFTALPAAVAIRWFLVLQPILAGLGVYWFLRAEGTNRPAATAGGLVMSLMMADSYLGLEIPFAGAIAWTALTLAAAARMVHAERWGPRLVWLALTAVAWGQIAGAHLSHGLVTGTGLLVFYLAYRLLGSAASGARDLARGARAVRHHDRRPADRQPRGAAPEDPLPPEHDARARVHAARPTSPTGSRASRPHAVPHVPITVGASWVLGPRLRPGRLPRRGRAGARVRGPVVEAPPGPRDHAARVRRAWRSSRPCAGSPRGSRRTSRASRWPTSTCMPPSASDPGVLTVLPILIGLGVHAWSERGTWRRRVAMLAPGLGVWWVLNAVAGRPNSFPALFLLGSLAAVAVLAVTAWRPSLVWLDPCAPVRRAHGERGVRRAGSSPRHRFTVGPEPRADGQRG